MDFMRFKARVKIWLTIGLLCIGFFIGRNISNALFQNNRQEITFSDNTKEKYLNEITLNNTNKFKTKDKSENGFVCDFILNNKNGNIVLVKENDLNETKSNSTFYEKAYSPIIAFVNDNVDEDESIFAKTMQKGRSNVERDTYTLDLSLVLNGMLEEKTWQDLGVSSDLLEGPITMTIPTMKEDIGLCVWNTIYTTLKNSNSTKIIEEELVNKTNIIIQKCRQSSNLSSEFYDIYYEEDDSRYYKSFYLIPEYLMLTYEKTFNDISYVETLIPVHFQETIAISYDIYLNNNNGNLEDAIKSNIDNMVVNNFGLRVNNSSYNITEEKDVFQKTKKVVNVSFIDDKQLEEIKEKINIEIVPITSTPIKTIQSTVTPTPIKEKDIIDNQTTPGIWQGVMEEVGENENISSNEVEETNSTSTENKVEETKSLEETNNDNIDTNVETKEDVVSNKNEESNENNENTKETNESEEEVELTAGEFCVIILLVAMLIAFVGPFIVDLFCWF